jgi:hypothetical protein
MPSLDSFMSRDRFNTPFHRTVPTDPKWVPNANRQSFEHEGRAIYPLSEGFVISEHGSWIPGAYASFEAAEAAFEFDDDTLAALQARANAAAGPEGGIITLADLRAIDAQEAEAA